MTPEEYQRIKEAEKEHLKAIKKLKVRLRQAESRGASGAKKSSLEQAMDEIENAPGNDILDTHEEMIDRLAMDAIHQEARLELALSSQKDIEPSETNQVEPESTVEDVEGDTVEDTVEESTAQSDEELQQLRAKELIRKMKIQMGLDNLKRKQSPTQNVTGKDKSGKLDSESINTSSPGTNTPAEKLPEELPEKTIGRIPKK